jgi:hypothetical protein
MMAREGISRGVKTSLKVNQVDLSAVSGSSYWD